MVSKKRIGRFIRNVSITIVVLLVLFVGAGVLYTWFVGKSQPTVTSVEETESTEQPTIKKAEIDPKAPESASIQSLSTPVIPGDNASIIVKTNPGSWCTITVVYNKIPSKDSGLIGKTSDDFGVVSWSWTVESTAPVGKWPVTVTCLRNKLSAVVIGDLIVKETINN